jgi:predicted GH43/DUF377 family glycosyl hydrolase
MNLHTLIIAVLFTLKAIAFEGLEIVSSTKRIVLKEYPGAFNPSLIKTKHGLLLSFRYSPDVAYDPNISYIGVVFLDENLDPIAKPELLSTRSKENKIPSQSEDARLFSYRDRIFLIYNDNADNTAYWQKRDMFLAELFYQEGQFSLSTPLKLIHEGKSQTQPVQKNWVPFEWDKKLFIAYSVNPHEIIYPNLVTGSCYQFYETWVPFPWDFGKLRLSTPPLLVDGEYLAFFHSGKVTQSSASNGWKLWHYFMGAYTFSAEPPFQITKTTPLPLIHDDFYTLSGAEKRVVFPGGFVVVDSTVYVAYGKDDCEIWIATIDKTTLKNALVPVSDNL